MLMRDIVLEAESSIQKIIEDMNSQIVKHIHSHTDDMINEDWRESNAEVQLSLLSVRIHRHLEAYLNANIIWAL